MYVLENEEYDSEAYSKLAEAERQTNETAERFSQEEVLDAIRQASRAFTIQSYNRGTEWTGNISSIIQK